MSGVSRSRGTSSGVSRTGALAGVIVPSSVRSGTQFDVTVAFHAPLPEAALVNFTILDESGNVAHDTRYAVNPDGETALSVVLNMPVLAPGKATLVTDLLMDGRDREIMEHLIEVV